MRLSRYLPLLCLGLAGAAQAAPAFVTEIPFDDCKGMICIQARMDDGKPATLILDTGDATSMISLEAAKAHGWTVKPYVGWDGKPVDGLFDAGTHSVGLGELSQPVHFLAISAEDQGSQGLFDGNLVYRAFMDRVLQIDYPHRRLRVSAVLTGTPTQAGAPGKLEIVNFHKWGPPIVVGSPFTINGKTVRAQIDSAYTGTMLVYSAAIGPLGLSTLSKQGKGEFFPFTDGGVNMLAAPARSEGFADRVLATAGAVVYFPTKGVHEPENPFEATVGNALFKDSVVTLDFHDMTLDVQPAAPSKG